MFHLQRLLQQRKRLTMALEEELYALQGRLSPEIHRYLRAYKREFKRYQRPATKKELIKAVLASDIVFNGDYHTLAQSQRIPLRILREVVKKKTNVVLATEVVMMKYQRHLDAFLEGEIDEETFLKRIEYNSTWGFEWNNFRPWFDFAKYHHLKIVGLNTGKTGQNLQERDKRAAELIAGLTMLYPKSLIYVIFGELHMSRGRIPGMVDTLLESHRIRRRFLAIFENSETIYWQLAKKRF